MTILIKGMEMPATGGFITLHICGDGTVRVVNKATGGVYIAPTFEEANGTDERIRASSVPTPHGRLIDADAFKAMLIDALDDARDEFIRHDDFLKAKKVTESLLMDIDEAPTVIEAEVEE